MFEAGKIKIGAAGELRRSKSGGEYHVPVKLRHFVVTTGEKNPATGNFKPDPIMQIIGAEPTTLDVRLLFDRIEDNWVTCYSLYSGRKCLCRGDGLNAQRRGHKSEIIEGRPVITLTGADEEVICGAACAHYRKDCKPYGILACVLDKSQSVGGVYKFRTTGTRTIKSITAALAFIKSVAHGLLAGIPLRLRLDFQDTTIPKTGKPTTIPVVTVEWAGTVPELQEYAMSMLRVRSKHEIEIKHMARGLLAAETPQIDADVNEEFNPDTMEIEVRGGGAVIDAEFDEQHGPAVEALDIPEDAYDEKPKQPQTAPAQKTVVLPTGDKIDKATGEVLSENEKQMLADNPTTPDNPLTF
jgi:hypothetical protein